MKVTWAHRLLTIHAIAVPALTVLYAGLYLLSFGAPDAGPTSGVGILPALLPLTILGLPWSCAFWVDPYAFDDSSDLIRQLVMVGPAWLNLAVHAGVHAIRTARSPASPADPA